MAYVITRTLTGTMVRGAACFALLLAPIMRGGAQGGDRKELDELRSLIERQRIELNEQRRQINALDEYLRFAPAVEVVDQDYVKARAGFKTSLIRRGPSPDIGAPVVPPGGVAEIQYPSGPLRLKAWVNRPADASRQLPAVLFLHGGFAFTSDDWEQSKPYRDAGFVVLTPMLRGENGQPGAFSYFYDEVDDVLAAVAERAPEGRERPFTKGGEAFATTPSGIPIMFKHA